MQILNEECIHYSPRVCSKRKTYIHWTCLQLAQYRSFAQMKTAGRQTRQIRSHTLHIGCFWNNTISTIIMIKQIIDIDTSLPLDYQTTLWNDLDFHEIEIILAHKLMNFDTSQYYNEYISDKKRDEKPNRNLPDNTKAANLTFFCPVCQSLINMINDWQWVDQVLDIEQKQKSTVQFIWIHLRGQWMLYRVSIPPITH